MRKFGFLSPEALQLVQSFYTSGTTQLQILEGRRGQVAKRTISITKDEERTTLSKPDFVSRVHQICKSRRVISSCGYNFEIAEVNSSKPDTTVHVSTYNSSIRSSPGNLALLALEDLRHVVYVSSLGRGGTSRLHESERRRFAATSSLLVDEKGAIDPLPVSTALCDALQGEGIQASSVRSDSSGRILASALGGCLPRGDLRFIFHNSPSNIGNSNPTFLVARLLIDNYLRLRIAYRDSCDPNCADSKHQTWAKAISLMHPFNDSNDSSYPSLTAEIANYRGLTRKCLSPLRGSAVRDLLAVIERHPHANCGLVLGGLDPLSSGVDLAFLGSCLQRLSDLGTGWIRAAILPGIRHNSNAAYPGLFCRLEEFLISPGTLPAS